MNYFVCDIIGDGLTPETAFRPANADEGAFTVAAIPSNPEGTPAVTWCFVKSESEANTPQSRKLPELPPQAAQAAKDRLDQILNGMGIVPNPELPEYAAAVAMIDRDYS